MNPSTTESQKSPKNSKRNTQDKKEKNSFQLKFLLTAIIALFGFSLYNNSIENEYVLDDFSVIKENYLVKQGISAIPLILKTPYRYGYWSYRDNLYRPISLVTFAMEWEYFPENPHVSHFINVLFFSICGIFLFVLLCKLFPANFIIPFVCSILFVAHPIHTEVVANIKSRDEIFTLFFLLLTWLCALKYLEKKSLILLAASCINFLLALLSKESGITFFALVPVTVYYFTKTSFKNYLPLFVSMSIVAVIYLLIRHYIFPGNKLEEPIVLINNSLVNASGFTEKYATAMFVLGKYITLLFFPLNLSFDYSFNQISLVNWTNYVVWLAILFYGFITIFAIVKFKEKNLFSFSIFLFLIPLSIDSNIFILIESTMAERFLFIPSLGFCLAVSLTLTKIFKTEGTDFESNKTFGFFSANKKVLFALLLILIPYSVKTINRIKVWKDNLSLYTNDVLTSPKSARVHYLLGTELIKFTAEKVTDKTKKEKILLMGIAQLGEAIKIYPAYSDALNQTGVAYYKMRKIEKALEFFLEAQNYNSQNAEIKNNLGSVYFEQGLLEKAEEMFRHAIAINPNYSDGLRNLGSVCGETARFDEAIQYFQKAVKLDPKNATLFYYIGMVYRLKKDEAHARLFLEKSVQLNSALKIK